MQDWDNRPRGSVAKGRKISRLNSNETLSEKVYIHIITGKQIPECGDVSELRTFNNKDKRLLHYLSSIFVIIWQTVV